MTDHRFQGYAHPELYKMINSGPGVSASIPVEQGWKTIKETLAQIDGDLHTALSKMGAGWESDAADAAGAALSPLAQWAGYAEQGSGTMESSARLQGEFIADARKKMPEVVPVTTEKPGLLDIAVGGLTGPVGMAHVVGQQLDHEKQEAAADNAAAQAVKVMEDYQSDSRWNSSTLGEFPEPPQVVIDTPPPAGSGTENTRVGYSSTGTPTVSGHNTGTTSPSWATPPSTQQHVQTWTPPPTDTTHTSWVQPPTPTPTPPVHTPLPTNLPTPEPRPTPVGPVFTRPTTSGTTGVRGGGAGGVRGGQLGSGKAFGPMSGSLGASGQQGSMKPGAMGMGSGPEGMRGGAMGSGGAAGKGGAAGSGAGGAHGQKGEGEDDIEHKAADYLVETDDVFGDERMVAPPVIGGFSE
ncbi:PPE domain-containing protein [Lentzea aerocolonigenes]|uniref:PPE domain-containing protein n=1 Tax=Lentzea aerocolonigenes TaxID=68170 RepID=UPI000696FA56|nr:PPE domain-containing protein [Lentzea aerocolonigenes]